MNKQKIEQMITDLLEKIHKSINTDGIKLSEVELLRVLQETLKTANKI